MPPLHPRLWLAPVLMLALVLAACEDDPTADTIPGAPDGPDRSEGRTEGAPGLEDAESESVAGAVLADVEVAVATVATGLDRPVMLAAADGALFIAMPDGRLLLRDEGRPQAVARLEDGERWLGLAAEPSFPRRPYVYALVAGSDDGSQLVRFVFDPDADGDDTAPARSVLEEFATQPEWGGNALAVDADGNLWAALRPVAPAPVDVEELAAQLLDGLEPLAVAADALPCATAGAGSGPWQLVASGGVRPASTATRPLLSSAPLWMPQGAAAAAVYQHQAVPQWRGSLLVVTEEGHLLRIPADAGGCPDLAASELLFPETYGRLSDVAPGPDGHLYILTANRDHQPRPDDDRVLRIGAIESLGLLYPDLRTQPPRHLELDRALIDGANRAVLRFSNLVMNLGEGPLEVWRSHDGETVLQRVYAEDGSYLERPAGDVTFHWSHGHWHFDHFNRFELWERDAYERWLAGDRDAEPSWVEDKVSMCLMDLLLVAPDLPGASEWGRYTSICEAGEQGISVGWGDIYVYDIREQWVVLGDGALDDGDYVLRSIVDSEDILHESTGGHDQSRESHEANGAATWFTVSDGRLEVTRTESGAGDEWAD